MKVAGAGEPSDEPPRTSESGPGTPELRLDSADGPVRETHAKSLLSICGSPWAVPNFLLGAVELAAAVLLLVPGRRVLGASIGLAAMACAAGYSTWAGVRGISLTDCGCFGPLNAPWTVHLLVSLGVASPCALALTSRAEESRLLSK
jgi:hypothetical protein